MNRALFAVLIIAALAISACDKKTTVTEPAAPQTNVNVGSTLQSIPLTLAQQGEAVEMFYLGEDMSPVVGASANAQIYGVIADFSPMGGRGGMDMRHFFDMEAMMYFRAAIQANSDLTDQQKTDIQNAINASTARRLAIVQDTTLDAAAKTAALKAEHDSLMATIKGANGNPGILTADQVTKTDALIAQIEAMRQQMHTQMLDLRIKWQVAMWDKVLNLTVDQKDQIDSLLHDQDKQIEAARTANAGNPEAFRQAVLAIQTATQTSIRALLTDAQKVLWDQMLSGKFPGGMGGDGGGMHHRGGRH